MDLFNDRNPAAILAVTLLSLTTCSCLARCIYLIFFHPLAKYPGPILAKVTDLYSAYHGYVHDIHIDVLRCHEKYGDTVRYGPNKLVTYSATGFHDIYGNGKTFKRSKAYLAFRDPHTKAQNTFNTLDEKTHSRKRRLLAQGLTDAALRGYEPIVKGHINILCDGLSGDTNPMGAGENGLWSSSRNMSQWSRWFAFDVMADIVFSQQTKLLTSARNRFVLKAIDGTQQHLGVAAHIPHIRSVWIIDWLFFRRNLRDQALFKTEARRLAMARMQQGQDGRRDVYRNVYEGKDPETGGLIPLPELGSEAAILVIAGSDTTSAVLSATLFHLSRNKKQYERLADEVRNTFSSVGDIATSPALRSCLYLKACIDEAMRLNPPSPSPLWREAATSDARIDGEIIPAGTWVGTSLYALHHNASSFPQPFKYSPERWIPSEFNSQDQVAAMSKALAPFSMGPRMCVAKNVAMNELLLVVAQIIYTMDFKPADGEEGHIGEGRLGMGFGRERREEFQTYARFVTHDYDGPILQFRKRL